MVERETPRTVTRKGQVTIPSEIRNRLGIKPNDQVTFRVEGERVYLMPVRETLETAYGAVRPLRRPEDFQDLRDRAIQDHAEQTLREMAGKDGAIRDQPGAEL